MPLCRFWYETEIYMFTHTHTHKYIFYDAQTNTLCEAKSQRSWWHSFKWSMPFKLKNISMRKSSFNFTRMRALISNGRCGKKKSSTRLANACKEKSKKKRKTETKKAKAPTQITKWFTIALPMWTDPFNLNLWIIILCVHRWITSELLEYKIGVDPPGLQDNLFSVRYFLLWDFFLFLSLPSVQFCQIIS